MGQAHGITSTTPVDARDAGEVARVMQALATSSRVQILGRLRAGACTVGELTDSVGMSQPAVSHQLRLLRDAGLVVGVRSGRNVVYDLHDSHVTLLLDEALRHVAHHQTGDGEPPKTIDETM